MMEIRYQRNLNKSHMILTGLQIPEEEQYSLNIILQNKIPGLLQLQKESVNGEDQFFYDISSRQALDKIFEAVKMTREDLKAMVLSLKNCMVQIEEYLLNPETLLLSPEYIYTDPDKKNYYFCCHPGYSGNPCRELESLFEQFLSWIDYNDADLVRLAYELHQITEKEDYRIQELEDTVLAKEEQKPLRIRSFVRTDTDNPAGRNPAVNSPGGGGRTRNMQEDSVWSGHTRKGYAQARTRYTSAETVSANERAERRGTAADERSFFEQLRDYLKGRKLREVIRDLDDGVFLQKLHQSGGNSGGSYHDFRERGVSNHNLNERPVSYSEDRKKDASNSNVRKKDVSDSGIMENRSRKNHTFQEDSFADSEVSEQNRNCSTDWTNVRMNLDEDEGRSFWETFERMNQHRHGTVLLGTNGMGNKRLIGIGLQQGNVIVLNRYPFSLGKGHAEDCSEDHYYMDSCAVSRIHARIGREEGNEENYWLEDLNSTNGTYINGSRLEPYTKQTIHPGDLISFADQEYFFK